MRDIVCNATTLTRNGKVGLLSAEAGGEYWLERVSHVQEEMALRGIGFPAGFMKDASVPKPSFPDEPRAQRLVRDLGPQLAGHQYVVKLGKSKDLEPALKEGRWRISPASTYAAADPSLSVAQRDTELEMNVYLPKSRLKFWDGKTGKFKGEGETVGNITRTSRASDYYVSCLTKQLDPRLFDDFQADCCIIVHDPTEFARRMFVAAKKLLPSWHGIFRDVRYVDPYLPPPDDPQDFSVFCSKDFRFWYQKEVRFAWLPEQDIKNLDYLFLELGDISDICQMAKL